MKPICTNWSTIAAVAVQAEQGRASAVWIEGDAGAGKTALLRSAVEQLPAAFSTVRAEADECKSAIAELEQKNDPQDQATLMTWQKKLEWCEAQLAHVGQAA